MIASIITMDTATLRSRIAALSKHNHLFKSKAKKNVFKMLGLNHQALATRLFFDHNLVQPDQNLLASNQHHKPRDQPCHQPCHKRCNLLNHKEELHSLPQE